MQSKTYYTLAYEGTPTDIRTQGRYETFTAAYDAMVQLYLTETPRHYWYIMKHFETDQEDETGTIRHYHTATYAPRG